MNWVLIINDALSAILALICWWLAHQNSNSTEPFGKAIATGYSLLAMAVLFNALFRSIPDMENVLTISLLISKAILAFTLAMVAARFDSLRNMLKRSEG